MAEVRELPADRAHALARILARAVVKAIQQEDAAALAARGDGAGEGPIDRDEQPRRSA